MAGRIASRTRADQRTFFLDSTGIGTHFTALAHVIHGACQARGLGVEIPSELFVEAVQPSLAAPAYEARSERSR